MNSGKPYTVSVRLMTYNHAKYIREAMESILAQQTDFNIEVVVGDDFSTDGTLDIVREYQSTEKIHIRILERRVGDAYWTKRQKLGRLYNFVNILENCTGEYIALLDGDDYWVDTLKLTKQVDFLESNQEFILVGTNAFINNQHDKKLLHHNSKTTFLLSDIALTNPFPTASTMFRNVLAKLDLSLITKTNFGDHLLYFMLQTLSGKAFKRFPDPSCVYRIHENGVYSTISKNERDKQKVKHFELLRSMTDRSLKRTYSRYISRICVSNLCRLSFPKNSNDYKIKIFFMLCFLKHRFNGIFS